MPDKSAQQPPVQGKPAIVITGASSGIGQALARVAAREGAFLLLLGRSQPALDDLAAELAASGAQSAAVSIDLLAPDAVERIEGELSRRGLYCDILINSAGFGVFGPAATTSHREHLDLIEVNIRALTDLTLRFLPGMVARRRGGIINLGSITGYAAGPNMSTYYASKAFVNSFSAALSAETAGTGVTVTCLAPGVVRTAFFERCGGRTKPADEADAAVERGVHRRGRVAWLQGRQVDGDSTRNQSVCRRHLPNPAEKRDHAICRCIAAPALKRSCRSARVVRFSQPPDIVARFSRVNSGVLLP